MVQQIPAISAVKRTQHSRDGGNIVSERRTSWSSQISCRLVIFIFFEKTFACFFKIIALKSAAPFNQTHSIVDCFHVDNGMSHGFIYPSSAASFEWREEKKEKNNKTYRRRSQDSRSSIGRWAETREIRYFCVKSLHTQNIIEIEK